jgi:arylsulfatase A-like enzyme
MRHFFLAACLLTPVAAAPPLAHWAFDGNTTAERIAESYGTSAFDAAEISGTNSWTTRPGFGHVLANGSNARYLTATAAVPGNASFTISLWSNRTASSGSTAGLLDALSASAGSGWQLFYQSNNTLRIRIDDTAGNSVPVDTTGPQVSLNTWQNIIVSVDRDASLARILINGTEATPPGGVSIASITSSIVPDQALWIGTLNGTNPAHGQIDDVAIFDRLLTPSEITAISSVTPVLTLFPAAQPPTPVTIHPPSGLLRPGETITLSNNSASQQIRYTLDGSDPTPSSPIHTAPLTPPASGEIRARSFDGNTGGPIASALYHLVPSAQPNILLIIADDLGFNDLGCYGAVSSITPNLDALAAEGLRFNQFTTAGPGDSASQHALLTGRLARRGATGAIDTREWTPAESLRKSGTHTAFIGTWHLGTTPGSHPSDQGFQTTHTSGDLATLTTTAANHLATTETPFLLVFQPPLADSGGNSLLGPYGNRVEALDQAVGTLLDQLDTSNSAENTLVIFLSDGGADRTPPGFPNGSNGQLRDGKGTTWEGGVRVPAIVRWPSVVTPGDHFAPIWLPDLHPSLVNLAAAFQPTDRILDGIARPQNLLGTQRRPAPSDPPLFLHRHDGAAWQLQAVRSGPWKLHLARQNTDPDNTITTAPPLLHQLFNDPSERINRAATEPAVLAALQSLAASHQATFASPVPQLPPARPPILGRVATTTDATAVTLTFTRPLDSLDDHYLIQRSPNLTDWTDHPITGFVTSRVTGPGETETLRLEIPLPSPITGDPAHFVRLIARRP